MSVVLCVLIGGVIMVGEHNYCVVVVDGINSELIDWWVGLSIVERELIMFQAYSKKVLEEKL